MSYPPITKDSTDVTVDVLIQDSSSPTGAGLTGLVFNSSGLVCYYRRGATGSATALTLATQTVGGAHSDGGFVEISAANMPGVYRLDLSDAICATGVDVVTLILHGAANMAPTPMRLPLEAIDRQDATSLGVSRIDATISSRASQTSVDTVDGVVDDILTDTAAIQPTVATNLDATVSSRLAPTTPGNTLDVTATGAAGIDWGNIENKGTINALSLTTMLSVNSAGSISPNGITANSLAADAVAEIADGVWDELSADHVAAGSVGERVERLDIIASGGAGGLTNARAVNLDNLDALVSSRSTITTAEVNIEIDTAIADANLDHLVGTATGIPAVPAGTFLDQIMRSSAGTFDRDTDSLQALRDRGDAAWMTGGSAADVAAIKVKTDQLNFTGADVKATLDAETVTLAAATHTGAVIPTVTSVTNPVTAGTVSDKTGYALSAAGNVAVGDALLVRDYDQVEAGAPLHSLVSSMLKISSRVVRNGSNLDIYQTDGATKKYSQPITFDATLEPFTELGVAV